MGIEARHVLPFKFDLSMYDDKKLWTLYCIIFFNKKQVFTSLAYCIQKCFFLLYCFWFTRFHITCSMKPLPLQKKKRSWCITFYYGVHLTTNRAEVCFIYYLARKLCTALTGKGECLQRFHDTQTNFIAPNLVK